MAKKSTSKKKQSKKQGKKGKKKQKKKQTKKKKQKQSKKKEQEAAPSRNKRRERVGKVVSNKMDKSMVVETERKIQHPKYGKRLRKTHKYMAHDENNEVNEGDWVRIMESRPFSKKKKWRLIEIVEKVK